MNESFKVLNYEDFDDAGENVNTVNGEIETAEKSLKTCQEQLCNESIFMGPIADLCKEQMSGILTKISSLKESFSAIASGLSTTKENYKTSDNTATKNVTEAGVKNQLTDKKNININNIKSGSNVSNALFKYKNELETSEYATVNDKIFTTTTNETINGQPVKVTHVVINNPNQINGAPANGKYANGLETSSSAASRLNSTILVNGSHSTSDGSEDLKGGNHIAIVNGQIETDGISGGQELLLDNNGNIYNVEGKSAQELVDDGVKYSFACHSTQVIVNGDISPSYNEPNQYI